jgi:hypothetical protein
MVRLVTSTHSTQTPGQPPPRSRHAGREMVVEGNNGGRWSSDGVVLWLVRWQNGVMVEWWGEWPRLR